MYVYRIRQKILEIGAIAINRLKCSWNFEHIIRNFSNRLMNMDHLLMQSAMWMRTPDLKLFLTSQFRTLTQQRLPRFKNHLFA